jgi:hypothetical protein
MKFICTSTNRFKKKEEIMRNVVYDWSPFVRYDDLRRAATAQQKKSGRSRGGGVVETVATGCEKELAAYCQGVTPGDGRILACLYAHADKLSGQCEYALFDAAAQLERAVAALAYLVNECGDDLDKHCAEAGLPGQKRKENSRRCKQALKDTGLK